MRLAALSPTYNHLWPVLSLLSVPSKTHNLCLHPPHRYTQPLPTGRGRAMFLEQPLYARHCSQVLSPLVLCYLCLIHITSLRLILIGLF